LCGGKQRVTGFFGVSVTQSECGCGAHVQIRIAGHDFAQGAQGSRAMFGFCQAHQITQSRDARLVLGVAHVAQRRFERPGNDRMPNIRPEFTRFSRQRRLHSRRLRQNHPARSYRSLRWLRYPRGRAGVWVAIAHAVGHLQIRRRADRFRGTHSSITRGVRQDSAHVVAGRAVCLGLATQVRAGVAAAAITVIRAGRHAKRALVRGITLAWRALIHG